MTVSALITRNDITATASQTVFIYTFRVIEATDMAVYQNGVLLSSGYTVTGVNNTTGGTVVLDVGASVGQIVSLVLAMPLDRTTNYQNSGKFLASNVNEDFDKIYIGAIQNENEGGRSLRLKDVEPPTTGVDMTIPLKADRLGKFLSFNATTGAPEVSLGTGADAYDSAAWSAYNFTSNGSTTAFALGIVPHSENNTQVYIDGVYQQKDGYSLSGSTITFSVAPPNLSTIEVMVTSALPVGSTSSDLVSYLPAGTGAVATTVQAKLRESVSVKDFGAVGDGVTDDTIAIQAAINAQVPLHFGGDTYKITSPITQILTQDVFWEGNNSKIIYDPASHTEYAIRLTDTVGVNIVINNIAIDGSKQCNKILEVLNNTSNTTSTNFVANELLIENCKRLNTFSGGTAVFLRGAFGDITFNGGSIRDCELPAGQGTSGSVGIAGLSITWYGDTSYARRVTLNGIFIEKVYSSDLAYGDDQDGFKYFAPDVSGGVSGKVESNCVIMGGCRFVNCYGRSIKTQVRNTVVRDSSFERTEGLTSGVGNSEVNAQSGSIAITACTFAYSNSQIPDKVIAGSTMVGFKSSTAIRDCEVHLESGTTLGVFYVSFPSVTSTNPFTNCIVQNCKVFGTVTKFVDFTTNSEKNHITISDNWVNEIAVEATTSQRNLIYVRTSGSSPRYAYVNARGNVYAGSNTAYLGRDSVAGTSMDASWSAYDNFGFVNNWNAQVNDASDPLSNHALATKITGEELSINKGYFGMQSQVIANGVTATFDFRQNNASLIILQTSGSQNQHAIFTAGSTTTSLVTGAGIALGNTTNPSTGDFNVWRSGTGEISVENDSGSSRTVSAWVFAPN